jgi:hypothetical protein
MFSRRIFSILHEEQLISVSMIGCLDRQVKIREQNPNIKPATKA